MTEELCRERFEEWFKLNGSCFYNDSSKRRMWRAWKSAWNTRAEMEKSDD